MNDFTKIIGSLQIKDNSIDINRLEVDFLKDQNWRINGTSTSKYTITTIPDPINSDDVANKHYIEFSKSLKHSYINTIYADKHETGFITYDKVIHDNSIVGIINEDLIIHVNHDIIASGNVKVYLNDNLLFNTDLITITNENNSYIEFSEEFYYNNVIDDNYKYVTAKLNISVNDMLNGNNSLYIIHNKSKSNTINWINEKNNHAIIDSITLSDIVIEDTKYLSGIEYITKAYFILNIELFNFFKYSFSDLKTPIRYICNKWDIAPDEFPSVTSSEDVLKLNKRIDIKIDRLNYEKISIQLEIPRPSRDAYISKKIESNNILFDSVIADSTDTVENFNDEKYRVNSDNSIWDSKSELHSSLMVSNGTLHYPKFAIGICYYYRNFIFIKNHQNFIIEIESENTDIITADSDLVDNNLKFELFINGRWKDIIRPFNGNELDDGCFAANIKNKIPFNWAFTLGLEFTSNILLRITASSTWRGSISKISLIGL